jgi:serine phosphatase RsbU (regulator of sigma subunit)
MTAACLLLSPDTGRVSFCGAGQPPLLIARRDGRVDSIRSARPPLGLNKAASSIEESCDLEDGDALLLYTDGLYEVQNEAGRRLGCESLTELLPPFKGSAADWLTAIIAKAKDYAGPVPFPDDIAAFAAARL